MMPNERETAHLLPAELIPMETLNSEGSSLLRSNRPEVETLSLDVGAPWRIVV